MDRIENNFFKKIENININNNLFYSDFLDSVKLVTQQFTCYNCIHLSLGGKCSIVCCHLSLFNHINTSENT